MADGKVHIGVDGRIAVRIGVEVAEAGEGDAKQTPSWRWVANSMYSVWIILSYRAGMVWWKAVAPGWAAEMRRTGSRARPSAVRSSYRDHQAS